MVFYVHTMRSEIEKIRHMSLSWRSSYYVVPFESYFLVTGFPQSYTNRRHTAADERRGLKYERPICTPAPLVDITVRILISSFLHYVVPRGISGWHPCRDLRPWHMRLKCESGRIPSTRERVAESGVSMCRKKKGEPKVNELFSRDELSPVLSSIFRRTRTRRLNACGMLCALPCTPTRRR